MWGWPGYQASHAWCWLEFIMKPLHFGLGAVALAIALVTGTSVLTSIGAQSSGATAAGLAFSLHDSGVHGSELNVGVQSDGDIFVGGWDRIARSGNAGASWTQHAYAIAGVAAVAADRVLIVDKDTDRVYVNDTDLVCTVLGWSDDDASTWNQNVVACGGGATDHQKIAVGKRTTLVDPTGTLYENIVYVCANGLTHTPCAASIDGGRTFGPGFASMQFDSQSRDVVTTCAFQGVPVASSTGVLYQPRTQCGAALWWSADNGMTWTHSDLPISASSDAPDVATTPDGAVYFTYTGSDWRPYVIRSGDGGVTWDAPVALAPSLRSSLFPVVTAGDDGRVTLAFYGTEDAPAGWNGNPGAAPSSVRWHLYAATLTGAGTGSMVKEVAQVTPASDPLQIGCLSKLGGCLGNIADYIDIDYMPDGRAVIVYVDGCPPGCTTAGQSTADDAMVAVQTAGELLFN